MDSLQARTARAKRGGICPSWLAIHCRPFTWLRWVTCSWLDALNDVHGLTATRASDNPLLLHAILVCRLQLSLGVDGLAKQSFGLGKSRTIAGCQETVVAHFDKASGQHMLQKAMDEGLGREGAGTLLFGLTVLIAEGDLVILHLEDTLVAQGDAEDVGRQILEC